MDFGALPPEVNSARMYTGPGSAPMLAAASAWDQLSAELSSTAAASQSEVTGLTSQAWTGPASATMAAAAAPYLLWLNTTAEQAAQTGTQARAAVAAFDAAFAMTVPPPVIAANRAQLAALVATNFLGQNAAAIAATEAHYGQMWAQDAAAMYGYAGAAASATKVTPFTTPPQATNPAAQSNQGAATAASAAATGTQSTLSQMISTVPPTLQGLTSPVQSTTPGSLADALLAPLGLNPGDASNMMSNFMSSSASPMSLAGITQAGADIAVLRGAAIAAGDPLGLGAIDPFTPMLPGLGVAGMGLHGIGNGLGHGLGAGLGAPGAAASAAVGQASAVGTLSVPQSWSAAMPVASPATAAPVPATGWTIAAHAPEPGGAPGMPGMPMAGSGAGRGYGFAAPRYGFKPTVIARPVVAG